MAGFMPLRGHPSLGPDLRAGTGPDRFDVWVRGSERKAGEMHWNHRVVCTIDEGEEIFQVAEVYYEDDKPVGWTMAEVYGSSLDRLDGELERFSVALGRPVLDFIDGVLVERGASDE